MTTKEIKKELDSRGVDYPSNASKKALENLLLAAEVTGKPVLRELETMQRKVGKLVDEAVEELEEYRKANRHHAHRINNAISHFKKGFDICQF